MIHCFTFLSGVTVAGPIEFNNLDDASFNCTITGLLESQDVVFSGVGTTATISDTYDPSTETMTAVFDVDKEDMSGFASNLTLHCSLDVEIEVNGELETDYLTPSKDIFLRIDFTFFMNRSD